MIGWLPMLPLPKVEGLFFIDFFQHARSYFFSYPGSCAMDQVVVYWD